MITMTTQKKITIFDYDGTLVSMPKKEWLGESFNWENFINWMNGNETIYETAVQFINAARRGEIVIVVTARPEHSRQLLIDDLKRRNLNPHFIIMRPDYLCDNETIELIGANDQESIKNVIHKHHARYRVAVVDFINNKFGENLIAHAYDDQEDNLKVFSENGTICHLVENGNVRIKSFELELTK